MYAQEICDVLLFIVKTGNRLSAQIQSGSHSILTGGKHRLNLVYLVVVDKGEILWRWKADTAVRRLLLKWWSGFGNYENRNGLAVHQDEILKIITLDGIFTLSMISDQVSATDIYLMQKQMKPSNNNYY